MTALALLALALGSPLLPGCGGGGGGSGVINSGLTADFIASQASPGANTVSLQQRTESGANFDVVVQATTVTDFFGAAFHVTFDTTKVDYLSFDSSTSFLLDAPVSTSSPPVIFTVFEQPGELLITATRNQDGSTPGITFTGNRDLLVLKFRAIAATGSTSSSISIPLTDTLACDSSGGTPAPGSACAGPIAVSWFGGSVLAN